MKNGRDVSMWTGTDRYIVDPTVFHPALNYRNGRTKMVDVRKDALQHMAKALKLLDLAGLDVAACHLQLAIDRVGEDIGMAASAIARDGDGATDGPLRMYHRP